MTLLMTNAAIAEFDRRYADHFADLTRLCRAMGAGEDAQDIAQDTLVYGRSHLSQLRDAAKVRPWLRKMAVRAVGKRRSRTTSLDDEIDVAYLPQGPGFSVDTLAAIASLPERERIAITLAYGLGYDQNDIADLMDIRRGTVAATLWKARQKLARTLAADDAEPRSREAHR